MSIVPKRVQPKMARGGIEKTLVPGTRLPKISETSSRRGGMIKVSISCDTAMIKVHNFESSPAAIFLTSMSTGQTIPPRDSISAGTRFRRFSERRKGRIENRELGPSTGPSMEWLCKISRKNFNLISVPKVANFPTRGTALRPLVIFVSKKSRNSSSAWKQGPVGTAGPNSGTHFARATETE